MPADLRHVLLVGGPPGAGKSTVARRLARRHGLRLYSADTRTWEHRDRAIAAGVAAAVRWESLMPSARWETEATDLLAMSLHHERGRMVVDDLARLPRWPMVVAEGTTVPAAAAAASAGAVWLRPGEAFQRQVFAERQLGEGVLRLYTALTAVINDEAAAAGGRCIEVDGTTSVDAVLAEVETRFQAAFARTAETSVELRRTLLREANADIVRQGRQFLVRPWASGDAATMVRQLRCECLDPECDVEVQLTIAAFDALGATAILAPGHA